MCSSVACPEPLLCLPLYSAYCESWSFLRLHEGTLPPLQASCEAQPGQRKAPQMDRVRGRQCAGETSFAGEEPYGGVRVSDAQVLAAKGL